MNAAFQAVPVSKPTLTPTTRRVLQRQCACGEPARSPDDDDARTGLRVQRFATDNAELETVPPIVYEALNSPGAPMDADTRTFMEARFGHEFSRVSPYVTEPRSVPARLTVGAPYDSFELEAEQTARQVMSQSAAPGRIGYDFSRVRIHTGEKASASARAVNALAYTVGNDIVFDTGRFAPATTEGRRLLAHELAHVVQQGMAGFASPVIGRAPADDDDCTADTGRPPVPSNNEFSTSKDLNDIRISIFLRQPFKLEIGDSGPAVGLVQRVLLNTVCAGINREVLKRELAKEKFGAATRSAVLHFQHDHTDAIGRPLSGDGSVGPLTLGAMDKALGIAPLPPALDPEGKGDCYGVALDGPGEPKILSPTEILASPVPEIIKGEAVWELWNFDVAKHFVKTEHRLFLRNVVVKEINAKPADQYSVQIVGEASTTAGQDFNLPLSEARAHCTREALLEAGLDSENRLEKDLGYGEEYTQVRRKLAGQTPIDQAEDPTARKVSIVLTPKGTDECNADVKTRASSQFIARVACGNATEVRVNIGDVSDISKPTYREFIWMHDPWKSGCSYELGNPASLFEPVVTGVDFHLALRDPDLLDAPTEFAGDAYFQYIPGYPRIFGNNNLYSIGLSGDWNPNSCGVPGSSTAGRLAPIGPVLCGHVPAPEEGECGEPPEEDCSDTYKMSPARHYKGILASASADISRFFPSWLTTFLSVGIGGVAVAFQTTDLKGPQLSRAFLFAGLSTSGTADVDAATAPEKDVGKPVQLSIPGRTWNSDFNQFIDWQFPLPSVAKLVVHGGSNQIDIDAGDAGTFSFFALRCNRGGTRTYRGAIHAVSPVFCRELPYQEIDEEKCEEKEKCPESVRLAGHRSFTVKVGRATLNSLPVIGRKYADQYGCAVTAAFVNIQSEDGSEDERIYREFLLIVRNADCPFTVGSGHEAIGTFIKRQLATKDPDDILAPSDFDGGVRLGDDGQLRGLAVTYLPIAFKLPGNFDPKCTGTRGGTGVIVAASVVDCGEAPEPRHDTARDTSYADACNEFKTANSGIVGAEVTKLESGGYNADLNGITQSAPFVAAPSDVFNRWLRLPVGTIVRNGVFVGWANDSQGNEIPVVAFADFRILEITPSKTIRIFLLTDLCAFDSSGNVVLLSPEGCKDTYAPKGRTRIIIPIPVDIDRPPPLKGRNVSSQNRTFGLHNEFLQLFTRSFQDPSE